DTTELAELAGASENMVANALRELCEKDLLDAEPEPMSTIPGESRREAIARVARYGAAAAAGSMIVSATAATPAMAESVQSSFCATAGGAGKTCCICTGGSCWTSMVPEVPYIGTAAECTKYCEGKGLNFQVFSKEAKCA